MKQFSLHHIAFIFLLLLAAGCSGRGGGSTARFDREIYTPSHASGFSIVGAEGSNSVIIRTVNPWQGADSVVTELLILRDGESAPDGYTGQVLKGNAARIVAMSSTNVAMLSALGQAARVKGVSGIDFIADSCIQARRNSIADVGYEGNVNYELLLSLSPDIVLLYGVNGASVMEPKLRELGIPYMYVGDYLEESPLGKAEWTVALAELCGMRQTGEKFFALIPVKYEELKQRVKSLDKEPVKVMLNAPYGDAWTLPPSGSYTVRLIEDAGGVFVGAQDTGNTSHAIDIEQAWMLASIADVWLNTGQAKSLAEVAQMCPRFTDTEVYRKGNIYNNNRRITPSGGNDYFESAVVHPDLVLRDLIKIFSPDLVKEDFVYYRRLQ